MILIVEQITNQFNSINDIGWYGSSYQLTAAAFILPYGRICEFLHVLACSFA